MTRDPRTPDAPLTSESLALEAQARLSQHLTGEHGPLMARALSAALRVLFHVAPVNGMMASLPLLILLPFVLLNAFLILLIGGLSIGLLIQAPQNSLSLNLALLGVLSATVFLAVLLFEFIRIVAWLFGRWLELQYRFLLGSQASSREASNR